MNPKIIALLRRITASNAALLLMAVITGLMLTAWWTIERTDCEMRADHLQQLRMVAQSVNVEPINSLAGSEADLENPDYLRLKEQLTAVRASNPRSRFVYLIGRKADGAGFIFADSEPAGS